MSALDLEIPAAIKLKVIRYDIIEWRNIYYRFYCGQKSWFPCKRTSDVLKLIYVKNTQEWELFSVKNVAFNVNLSKPSGFFTYHQV